METVYGVDEGEIFKTKNVQKTDKMKRENLLKTTRKTRKSNGFLKQEEWNDRKNEVELKKGGGLFR